MMKSFRLFLEESQETKEFYFGVDTDVVTPKVLEALKKNFCGVKKVALPFTYENVTTTRNNTVREIEEYFNPSYAQVEDSKGPVKSTYKYAYYDYMTLGGFHTDLDIGDVLFVAAATESEVSARLTLWKKDWRLSPFMATFDAVHIHSLVTKFSDAEREIADDTLNV